MGLFDRILGKKKPSQPAEHAVLVHFAYGSPILRGGPLLTWECKMEVGSDGRWRVMLDFAHDGEVTFECESITAVTEPPPNQPLQPQS